MCQRRLLWHHGRVAAVACQVVRWVADEPQPGLVEAHLTDADGRVWRFIDKEPIFFCAHAVGEWTRFPVAGAIRCRIVGQDTLSDGRQVVTIDTASPDRVDSDGVTIFRVAASAISGQ
jgi:hypothetical protein